MDKYKKSNYCHCVWEIFLLSLIEPDSIRAQQVEIVLLVLSQASFRIYGLSRICATLQRAFDAYYFDYKYPPIRTCLDYQFFNHLLPKLNDILAMGFSAEIIAFRTYIEFLAESLSSDGRSLDLQRGTGRVFATLESILKSTGLSHQA